tara:strand:- start:751 stop:1089 length:339 start_codon:yes stop_codon:yes gene_type:complete
MDNVLNCDSLLSDKIIDDNTKFDLYEYCTREGKKFNHKLYNINNKNSQNLERKIHKYEKSKTTLDKLKENTQTLQEELKNNKNIINFLVIENRIIFFVILLLIFLIYKYILK